MSKLASIWRLSIGLILIVLLVSCGGGSGDPLLGEVSSDRDELRTWESGVYRDKVNYQNFCENPREGLDRFNDNRPYPDVQGTVVDENFFLRSWTNELYLWYDEVEDQNPNDFTSAFGYFDQLKTNETTSSGAPKDNFHFTIPTEDYLNNTVGGMTFGYGYELYVGSRFPEREYRIRDVIPGSPADLAGVQRGMLITTVDGADLINATDQASIDTINAGLFPPELGETHELVMVPAGSTEPQTFNLTSSNITSVPVKSVEVISTSSGNVGYFHFNSHIQPAERGLFDAFTTLANANVTDLVLDLRYNGGGLLAMAGQVAYMIAGSQQTAGSTFYQLTFNDQHPNRDPVTGQSLDPMPFFNEGLGFSEDLNRGTDLPSLDLSRVFILTLGNTCSASEAIINGLRGVNVEVIQIGDTTCGKPYGFYPQDNCGTTYFSVQFTGINDVGFGEYSDGFSPDNTPAGNRLGISLPGCWVEDDLSGQLGEASEGMLAAALQYRENGACPSIAQKRAVSESRSDPDDIGSAVKIPLLPPGTNNAIIQVP